MNDINNIVFEVYNSVLNMDYTRNEKKCLGMKIKKIYRYVRTGYIFSYFTIRHSLSEINHFVPTRNVYPHLKTCIYTVSTGKYDEIKEPIYIDPEIDYYIFTEQEINQESVWKKLEMPEKLKNSMTSLEQARYVKSHPQEFFADYEYSIFIDGNVRITCDIKPLIYSMIAAEKKIAIHRHQVRDCIYDEAKAIYAAGKASYQDLKKQTGEYKRIGFPKHFGLFETNIVIRNHNDEDCKIIMDTWWNEMEKFTKRDQMSFTVALWKNKKECDYVLSLGNNSRRNPYFIVDSHK